jgi:hypothetical protein
MSLIGEIYFGRYRNQYNLNNIHGSKQHSYSSTEIISGEKFPMTVLEYGIFSITILVSVLDVVISALLFDEVYRGHRSSILILACITILMGAGGLLLSSYGERHINEFFGRIIRMSLLWLMILANWAMVLHDSPLFGNSINTGVFIILFPLIFMFIIPYFTHQRYLGRLSERKRTN